MEHDKVLERIGGCGKFTKLAALILVVTIMTGDLINNNMSFYDLMQKFECQDLDDATWYECTPINFCNESGSQVQAHREDISDPQTL